MCPECSVAYITQKQREKAEREFLAKVESKGHKLLSPYKGKDHEVYIDFNCGHPPEWMHAGYYKTRHKGKCKICNQLEAAQMKKEKTKKEIMRIVKERKQEWIDSDIFEGIEGLITIDFKSDINQIH